MNANKTKLKQIPPQLILSLTNKTVYSYMTSFLPTPKVAIARVVSGRLHNNVVDMRARDLI